MRRRGIGLIAVAALVAVGTLFAAGCGDDDSSSAVHDARGDGEVHGRA